MSELSVRQYLHNDGSGLTLGYDKAEADKVIAEKESKIVELEDKLRHYPIMVAMLESDTLKIHNDVLKIRRHKYKRCLAMARWCMAQYNEWSAYYPTTITRKMKFLDKWKKRWRELAEKFKEAK